MLHATIKLTIGNVTRSGFGWTANMPRFGLLGEQSTTPASKIWSYDSATPRPATAPISPLHFSRASVQKR